MTATATAKYVTNKMIADKCYTMSRARSHKKHRNFTNKYTKCLGERDYKGINDNGYFTKFYPYGVVGHCAIGVQAWFIWCGLTGFVPRSKGYIWNTNVYRKWLKSEPTIKGYGKVNWTTNRKKAKLGAVCFKGDSNKKNKNATHTCIFLYNKGDYVYTVNFNVTGKYKGKKINNGVIKKYHKNRIKGFANMPYPKAKKVTAKTYEITGLNKGSKLNIRKEATKKSKSLGKLAAGTKVKGTTIKDGWVYIPAYNGWCAKRYLK